MWLGNKLVSPHPDLGKGDGRGAGVLRRPEPHEGLRALVRLAIILLVIISFVYLVLGTVFEDFSLMIIMLPFVLPAIQAAGYDPIWFGVYMCMLLEAGLLSPPVGLNLFVIQGVTGAPLGQVVRGAVPFLFLLLTGAASIVTFPQIALWLPSVWVG